MENKPEDSLLTIVETCAILKIGRKTLHKMICAGEIRSVLVRHRRRIPSREIDRFIQERLESSAIEKAPV
jgi:excisionase family DNA binding protein